MTNLLKLIPFLFLVCLPSILVSEIEMPIESEIRDAIAHGKKPVIFVDLDATLFSEAGRIRNMLEWYDEVYQKKIFKNTEWSRFTSFTRLPADVEAHVVALENFRGDKSAVIAQILKFESLHRFDARALLSDTLFAPLKKKLIEWSGLGAEIVYLTGRGSREGEITLKVLKPEGLDHFPILTKPTGPKAPQFKPARIESYLIEDPNRRAIALLDDELATFKTVRAKFPKLFVGHVNQQQKHSLQIVPYSADPCTPLEVIGSIISPKPVN